MVIEKDRMPENIRSFFQIQNRTPLYHLINIFRPISVRYQQLVVSMVQIQAPKRNTSHKRAF